VSSVVESTLGRSPKEIFHVEVVGELIAEFQRLEEQRSWLERPAARIWDLLLGPPPGWVWLADHLDEVAWQLRAELVARREADVEQEALWTLAVWVRDLVLDNINRPSSLAASLSPAVELLEGRIDAMAANGVH
jgi:hypothetical protein